MANFDIRVVPTMNFNSQLFKGVLREGSKTWARRAMAKASTTSQKIGRMLVTTFNNTPVAKSLRGQGPEDLPAHFGLTNSMANALADGMAELIRSSVRILSRGSAKEVSLRIQAVPRDWNSYLALPGAQYVSSPSSVVIPVVRWLLMDPTIDIGQAAYDIVFRGENQQLDVRIQKVSRSGRAIMVSLKALGGTGGYVLPDIISGQSGQNFIEYSLGQPHVAEDAAKILMATV